MDGRAGRVGRFYRTLRAEGKEYLAFTVLTFVLTLVVGIGVGFVVGILALLVFGPLVLVGFAGIVTAGASTVGAVSFPVLVALAAVGLLTLLLVMAVAALVHVPIVTHFRYYALLVLGDTDTDLDLIPERRSSVRAGSGGRTSGGESGAESA